MTAREADIRELFPHLADGGLGARLLRLEMSCRNFRRDLDAAIETPFGMVGFHEPDDPIIYSADEDGDRP